MEMWVVSSKINTIAEYHGLQLAVISALTVAWAAHGTTLEGWWVHAQQWAAEWSSAGRQLT